MPPRNWPSGETLKLEEANPDFASAGHDCGPPHCESEHGYNGWSPIGSSLGLRAPRSIGATSTTLSVKSGPSGAQIQLRHFNLCEQHTPCARGSEEPWDCSKPSPPHGRGSVPGELVDSKVDRIRYGVEGPQRVCAVTRRRFPVGASPTRQLLQPEATGAVMEVTKWLKPSDSGSRIGDRASVQAAT